MSWISAFGRWTETRARSVLLSVGGSVLRDLVAGDAFDQRRVQLVQAKFVSNWFDLLRLPTNSFLHYGNRLEKGRSDIRPEID
jgi:hypothetical protein